MQINSYERWKMEVKTRLERVTRLFFKFSSWINWQWIHRSISSYHEISISCSPHSLVRLWFYFLCELPHSTVVKGKTTRLHRISPIQFILMKFHRHIESASSSVPNSFSPSEYLVDSRLSRAHRYIEIFPFIRNTAQHFSWMILGTRASLIATRIHWEKESKNCSMKFPRFSSHSKFKREIRSLLLSMVQVWMSLALFRNNIKFWRVLLCGKQTEDELNGKKNKNLMIQKVMALFPVNDSPCSLQKPSNFESIHAIQTEIYAK